MDTAVIGASGQLGTALMARLAASGKEATGTYSKNPMPGMHRLDITDKEEVNGFFARNRPKTAILAACLTNVDFCETHRDEARKVNVNGVANVADACLASGTRLVFISTYYVFDGAKGSYTELDRTRALNFYGETKIEGEKIASRLPDSLTVRACKIYGLGGDERNFAARTLAALRRGESVKAAKDQVNNPVGAGTLADMVISLSDGGATGTYHAGGKEKISNYDFAILLAKMNGIDTGLITPVETVFMAQPAKRPLHCCLDTSKLERTIRINIPTIADSLGGRT